MPAFPNMDCLYLYTYLFFFLTFVFLLFQYKFYLYVFVYLILLIHLTFFTIPISFVTFVRITNFLFMFF